jgi:5-methyltetrahydropteroyltriglutamate--homocysteine methyltransferase
MSSKTPVLESKSELIKRMEQAAKYAPLDQFAIGPQCGFASSIVGNPMTQGQQEAKLSRLVEVATDLWGGV